jgi:hypothetical protein
MRKLQCICGGATFTEKYALYDSSDLGQFKDTRLIKDAFAYICDQCGEIYNTDMIEWFVVNNFDKETLQPIQNVIVLDKSQLEGKFKK